MSHPVDSTLPKKSSLIKGGPGKVRGILLFSRYIPEFNLDKEIFIMHTSPNPCNKNYVYATLRWGISERILLFTLLSFQRSMAICAFNQKSGVVSKVMASFVAISGPFY
jgi:hypothetical protein